MEYFQSIIDIIGNITVAVITGVCTVLVASLKAKTNIKILETRFEAFETAINDKFDSIDKKLETHNGYAEKFASCEQRLAEMAVVIEYIKEKADEKHAIRRKK